ALLLAGGLIIQATVKAHESMYDESMYDESMYHKAMHHESMHKESMPEKHMHKKDSMHKKDAMHKDAAHKHGKHKHKSSHRLMQRMQAQFMAGLDMDRDGQISPAEFAKAMPDFATLDTDGSGSLSASEWHKFTKAQSEKRKAHITQSMDANGDGQVSHAEKQAFYKKYGYMMDKMSKDKMKKGHMYKDHMHKDKMHKDQMKKENKKSGWSSWGRRKQQESQDNMPQ
ncbi:MAG: hypothetical protein OXT03_05790, partial [Alphaproteobacteria bacterium]|nr:hypothetical protein [Alphaproteobacteria bacterium]